MSFPSAAQCDQKMGDFCTSIVLGWNGHLSVSVLLQPETWSPCSPLKVELGLLGDFKNITTVFLGAMLGNSYLL